MRPLEMKNVNTVTDLVEAATDALEAKDEGPLEELVTVVDGWLMNEKERAVFVNMLHVMMYTIDELNQDNLEDEMDYYKTLL